MNILVTGGAGYLGTVLLPKLLARGHRIRVLEIGYFGLGHLRTLKPPVEVVREDLRRVINEPDFADALLKDMDAVIHLAAISNDPSAELHPELTEETNYQATAALAEKARAQGIRFLFSSSCSVYGEAEGEITEQGSVNPLTAYATSKVRSEQALQEMATDAWRPVILRNGTLFGYSPRMRFDLVVNIFSLYGTLENRIRVFGDGMQWRPFLHVSDCARAFLFFAESEPQPHLVYNIANENLRVVDIAAIFQKLMPQLEVAYLETPDGDRRDYRVSADRLAATGFRPRISVEAGAEEMIEAIITGVIADPESIYYRNAKWLKELTQLGAKTHRDVVQFMETMNRIRL